MNKKGFGMVGLLIGLAIILIAIILIIIFSNRIAPVTTPIFDFLSKWWWTFPVIVLLIVTAPLWKRLGA